MGAVTDVDDTMTTTEKTSLGLKSKGKEKEGIMHGRIGGGSGNDDPVAMSRQVCTKF